MKNISFPKYMLKNGVIPMSVLTIITILLWVFDSQPDISYPIMMGWMGLLWIFMTIANYILWKTGIPDLFSAIKSLRKK